MSERERERGVETESSEREKRIATRWRKRDRHIPNRTKEGSRGIHGSVSQVRERDEDNDCFGEGARRSQVRVGIEAQPEQCCRLLATSRRLPTRACVERGPTKSSYDSVIFSRVVAQCLRGQFRSEYVQHTFYSFVLFLNAHQAERGGKRRKEKEKERKGSRFPS